MAKYTIKETSEKLTNGKAVSYPKMVKMGLTSSDEFANLVKDYTGFSPALVKGVLDAVSIVATSQMALGFHVQVGEIGILSPKLGYKKGLEREDSEKGIKRNATSIEVTGINFKASKSLIQKLDEEIILERTSIDNKTDVTTTMEERLEIAIKYLKEESVLHVKEYAALTGLNRSKAGLELKSFAQEGLIRVKGRSTHIYYTLAN